MRDADNILQVASFAPDYMGFIFYPASPRFVGVDFKLPPELPYSITKVGVFVNEDTKSMLAQCDKYGIDHVQLHGNESAGQVAELKDSGLTVIKVFSVDDRFSFNATKPYVPVADYFLFDTKGKLHGGNARTFNWDVLGHYDQELPFFLSGGLSPENVGDVLQMRGMNLRGIDVNSGVEEAPGKKSIEKLRSLYSRISPEEIK